ncbi:MAG TPA: ketoacyl-ACP synthase III [Bryobacteraceae bacterium]|nr:ketoacyl-ACP synthase III [Bryobacteraceae bacterium]
MSFIREFGSYLPARVVGNEEMGARVGCDAEWIMNVSGIEERRFAAPEETVVDLALKAAEDCLQRARCEPRELGMVMVASGSAERQFPGPACSVANRLGLNSTPAIDLPMASAGSLFGMSLAARLASAYGNILVLGAEKMSSIILRQPMERGVAILFGDGAGACLVASDKGMARIIDSDIHTDGTFAEDLRLEDGKPLEMNGRSVILQASRKIPRSIDDLLRKHGCEAKDIDVFLMHQANQNLISRVAQALGVSDARFYSNIRRFGNTSSASMLIAAAEWAQQFGFTRGQTACFAGFGAGFNWGALLAQGAV